MTEIDTWSHRLTRVTALAVYSWRTKRRLSTEALAERCAELGHPISRSSLANLESKRGRPSISVADVFVLAAALEIPPVALLVPAETAGDPDRGRPGLRSDRLDEVLPGEEASPVDAWKWIVGLRPLDGSLAAAHYITAAEEMNTLARHEELVPDVDSSWFAERMRIEEQGHVSEASLREIAERLALGIDQLHAARAEMKALGMTLPELPRYAAEALKYGEEVRRWSRGGQS